MTPTFKRIIGDGDVPVNYIIQNSFTKYYTR